MRIFLLPLLGFLSAPMALGLLITPASGDLIYSADFSNEGDGFPDHDNDGGTAAILPPAVAPQSVNGGAMTSPEGRWTASYTATPSTDNTANEFSVDAMGNLRIQDWGNTDARWESFSVDVSGWNSVDIDALGVTLGNGVQNAMAEKFHYFYTLDGGADQITDIALSGDTAGTAVNYDIAGLDVSGASNLTVGFVFRVNDANDGYSISSFQVNGVTPVPEPSAFLTSAMLGLFLLRRRKTTRLS